MSEPDPAEKLADQIRSAFAKTYLSEQQMSDRYGISCRTLQRWRVTGEGPPYARLGMRRVFYRIIDAEAWAANRSFASRAAESVKAAEMEAA